MYIVRAKKAWPDGPLMQNLLTENRKRKLLLFIHFIV